MSEDQFVRLMAAIAESNRIANEANSIARGTAVAVAILYDKFAGLEKEFF
jgi:hypothetical protein